MNETDDISFIGNKKQPSGPSKWKLLLCKHLKHNKNEPKHENVVIDGKNLHEHLDGKFLDPDEVKDLHKKIKE